MDDHLFVGGKSLITLGTHKKFKEEMILD